MRKLCLAVGLLGCAVEGLTWGATEWVSMPALPTSPVVAGASTGLLLPLRPAEPDRAALLDEGTVLAGAEQYELAAERFREALWLEPDCLEARQHLALCLLLLGRTAEATVEWARLFDAQTESGSRRQAAVALKTLGVPVTKAQPGYLTATTIDRWRSGTTPARLPGDTLLRLPARSRTVALTFDDSPTCSTRDLLDLLARHRIPATFFVIGRHAAAHPDPVREIARQGHQIGNHTYSHQTVTRLRLGDLAADLADTQELLERITGKRPALFRPPGGEIDRRSACLARALGLRTTLWSVNASDCAAAPEVSLRIARSRVRPGSVVLLHDTPRTVRELLPPLIRFLRGQGYRFVALPGN